MQLALLWLEFCQVNVFRRECNYPILRLNILPRSFDRGQVPKRNKQECSLCIYCYSSQISNMH